MMYQKLHMYMCIKIYVYIILERGFKLRGTIAKITTRDLCNVLKFHGSSNALRTI